VVDPEAVQAAEGRRGPGTLILVATPIGNLEDITLRALRVLREADILAAEDTRRTRKLLSYYNISRKLVSCHEHNEEKRIPSLLEAFRQGRDVALVSDAGSPGISDPGYRLVRSAAGEGIPVTAVPGASAVVLSLGLSGLPADRFSFYGFLPRKAGECDRLLEAASRTEHTLVFFESPRRVGQTLARLLKRLGDRSAAVCRELTKRFEQVERGRLSDLLKRVEGDEGPRGEYCIVVEGKVHGGGAEDEPRDERIRRALEEIRANPGEPLKEAARKAAARHGLARRDVYQAALAGRVGARDGRAADPEPDPEPRS